MSKIYSYAEFQKIAKVGMRVRAVKGRANACDELDDGTIQLITEVETDDDGFYINGCKHWGSTDGFLELLDDEPEQPERGEITWATLKIDDELISRFGRKYRIADIGINKIAFYLITDGYVKGDAWSRDELEEQGFEIIQPTKLETISLADAEKALGKRIIIKG